MASDIYNRMGPENNPVPAQQNQNPKEAALNMMRQMGFDISKEQENDPNACMQMVLRSGKVPQNRLSMAQNVLFQLMGRR